jgi:hypothetical protein
MAGSRGLAALVLSFCACAWCAHALAHPGRAPLVNFLAHCKVAGEARDDPIVLHGHPGFSHDHTFFGARGVDAYSTAQTLRGQATTCNRASDTAAYWVPTLYQHRAAVKPLEAVAYYTLREHTPVQPYPYGLEIVAGDSRSRRPQSLHIVWWTCTTRGAVHASPRAPVSCARAATSARARRIGGPPATPGIQLHVRFPDCWDGHHLDSIDHKRHMAYSVNGQCPSNHPVQLPSLILIVSYPITTGNGIYLSSGTQYSAHADFINSWHQHALEQIVHDCAAAQPHCARH